VHRPPSWRPWSPHALHWRQWDDEFVVYNDATGSTHHLTTLGGDVLLALLNHPAGIEMSTLVLELEQSIEVTDDVSLADEVARVLALLGELQLATCNTV
jgi:PqqD family protein of HPr-rel-A system